MTGTGHLAAGRDYIENMNVTNIAFILMTKPKENLDARAIVNERFFKHRFKLKVNKEVRKKLICFQNSHGFTDSQIGELYYSDFIHIRHNKLNIKSPQPTLYAGYSLVALATACFILLVIAFILTPHLSTVAGFTLLNSACVYVLLMWLIDKACLQPSRLLRYNHIYRQITY